MNAKNIWKQIGCFGRTCAFFFLVVCARTCAKSIEKEYHKEQIESNSKQESINMLNEYASEINKTLPKDMGEGITSQAVVLNTQASSPTLEYHYMVDDDIFMENKDDVLSKENQIAYVKLMYSEMKPVLDVLKKANIGLSYIYTCKESGETYRLDITYKELSKISK